MGLNGGRLTPLRRDAACHVSTCCGENG